MCRGFMVEPPNINIEVLHTSPSNAPIVNNVNSKLCHLQVS